MFPTFITILPLTIPANYHLPSQFLSVGLKVGVRVWFKVSVWFEQNWKFSDVSTEFLDMKYSNKQSAAV
jgi:hypothetical protein